MRQSPASIIVCVICFFSSWPAVGLAGFHTYLISSNLTTNEDIKGSYSRKRSSTNPYSRGIFSNFAMVLCGPHPPSLIDARGKVTPQFISLYADPPSEASYGSTASHEVRHEVRSRSPRRTRCRMFFCDVPPPSGVVVVIMET